MNFSLVGNNSIEEEQNKQTNTLKVIKTKIIDKMNFFDFKMWFDEIMDEDWKYKNEFKYFGIQIKLPVEIYNLKTDDVPLPKYPFKRNFVKMFMNSYENIEIIKKELDYEKKKNMNLINNLKKINFEKKKKQK